MSIEDYRPYEDPELNEAAHGDRELLSRMVAVRLLEMQLEGRPDDSDIQDKLAFMRGEVEAYSQTHPPNVPRTPE